MAYRLNVGALPFPLPRTLRKGFKKRVKADKVRFHCIAQGSIEESRYYLILAKDLEYGDASASNWLLEEVSKLLQAYSQAILTSEF
jgi:four helix bundle protein